MQFLLTSIFLLLSAFSYGQVFVSGININELDSVKVCQVTIRDAIKSIVPVKNVVSVDYGQRDRKAFNRITVKSTSEKMQFNSIGHVLNFMENNGWQHYESQSQIFGDLTEFYLYFRKK